MPHYQSFALAYQLQSLLIELHSQATAAFEERTLKAVDYFMRQTP